MKYKVTILPEANEDVNALLIYLMSELLSKFFVSSMHFSLYAKIYSLEFFPQIYQKVYKDYHRVLVKSYAIFYKIDEKKEEVIIYRILHQSQNFTIFLK